MEGKVMHGSPISLSSRKKRILALSSCKVGSIRVSNEACQALWIETLLDELKVMELKKMKLFVDDKSTIDLSNHLIYHGRSKHI